MLMAGVFGHDLPSVTGLSDNRAQINNKVTSYPSPLQQVITFYCLELGWLRDTKSWLGSGKRVCFRVSILINFGVLVTCNIGNM